MDEMLAELRKQIDSLDDQLCQLLASRLEVSRKVSRLKTDNRQIFRPSREAQLLARLLSQSPDSLKTLIPIVWRAIISSSIAEQRPDFTIVASAAMREKASAFSAGQLRVEHYNTAQDALSALEKEHADILLVSTEELSLLASQIGTEKHAIVIARLPLVLPGSESQTDKDIQGWIIARPPAEKTDRDLGVFYHRNINKIEITDLSSYEKSADINLLGFCTAIHIDKTEK